MKTKTNKLDICFMGGRQAGIIGALTVLARGYSIKSAVSYSKDLTDILKILNIPLYKSINKKEFIVSLRNSDLLLCIHGREIIKPSLLKLPKLGAINVHPYLYKYKGAYPVERAIKNNDFEASVGVHKMTEQVDEGEVLIEEFVAVTKTKIPEEIYNQLYPYYSIAILKALDIIKNE